MSSSVFFKFKSQKEPSRVEFDGTGISVFELKRDIIIKSGLGDGTDFDLAIYADNGKDGEYMGIFFTSYNVADNSIEYDDDTTLIPRSTSVIARRLPPSKPGAGRAARYMSGKMPINMKNSSRKEQASNKSHTTSSSNAAVPTPIHAGMTEEEQMAALFEAQNAQWNATQDEMAK
jgi:protein MPE1